MPLQIIGNNGPLTVTSIDARSIDLIRTAGGRVIDHTDFYHIFMPAGTGRRKITFERKERHIYKEAPITYYHLHGGAVLSLCQHVITYDEAAQSGENDAPAW